MRFKEWIQSRAKTCATCGEEKPLKEFPRHYKHYSKHWPDCKECHDRAVRQRREARHSTDPVAVARRRQYNNARSREWYARNAERGKFYRLKTRYGLSRQDWEGMLVRQNGRCAICGNGFTGREPFVDHDHATGHVRGLLCRQCNTVLASYKENPAIFEAAAKYLRNRGIV